MLAGRIVLAVGGIMLASACAARPDETQEIIGDPVHVGLPADDVMTSGGVILGPSGGVWRQVRNIPSLVAFQFMVLLPDGSILIYDPLCRCFRRMFPDLEGWYLQPNWTTIPPLPAGYAPLYFSAGVLPDGRVIIEGGEFNAEMQVWTTRGAIYNLLTNTWATVAPPAGWTTIGNASSAILADGRYMQSDCCSTRAALLNPTTMTWTATGTGKQGASNNEESWTRLWDGTILTVDCNNAANLFASEIYTPSTGKWTLAANTANKICGTNPDGSGSHKTGPQVLRYDGTVLAVGGAGHNGIYSQTTKTWGAAPDSPQVGGLRLDSADGPAVLLPNGNVLIAMSPGVAQPGTHMIEWDGTTFTEVAAPPRASVNSSFQQNFMLLPSGEVLLTDSSNDIEIYTPTNRTPVAAAVPAITSLSSTSLTRGGTFTATAQRMNGLSEAVAFGNDAQPATNYPLIRITSSATRHVFYCRTFNHSTRAIGPSVTGTTNFTVPAAAETGPATLELIANGIASSPVDVTVL